jgi:hypothetical protein
LQRKRHANDISLTPRLHRQPLPPKHAKHRLIFSKHFRLGSDGNGMKADGELAPLFLDLLEHRFQLALDSEIEHEGRGLDLLGTRLDMGPFT